MIVIGTHTHTRTVRVRMYCTIYQFTTYTSTNHGFANDSKSVRVNVQNHLPYSGLTLKLQKVHMLGLLL